MAFALGLVTGAFISLVIVVILVLNKIMLLEQAHTLIKDFIFCVDSYKIMKGDTLNISWEDNNVVKEAREWLKEVEG